jgi:hypothetical protein
MVMRELRLFVQFFGAAALLLSQPPQESAPPAAKLVFRHTVQEVLLDLVVRDKHERPFGI